MTTMTVGAGEQYSTIAAAVAASHSGDTINVDAGTYTNDVLNISHSLTLQAIGGTVKLVGTAQPANGKGIIDEGGPGVNVGITGFDISGAMVRDQNGAGVRYEGGGLVLNNVNIHDNQNGILANADANGAITIANSTFANNGIGDGQTHNIYVGAVGSLTVKDSTITSAQVGHDIKSRALSTTVTGNTITDGSSGTASYEIDLTNGGVGDIEGNFIEKGANAQNPIAITFGEEGDVYANSSLTVKNNTIVTNYTAHNSTAVVNKTFATASISGNQLYGWTTTASGPATVGSNVTLAAEPGSAAPAPKASAAPPTAVSSNVAVTPSTVIAAPAAPSFMADASAGVQQATPDVAAPIPAASMTGQTLPADAAAAMLPTSATDAAAWTGGPVPGDAADGSGYWSAQYQPGSSSDFMATAGTASPTLRHGC